MCELYPGEFEAMEHNGRMDAIEPSDMLSAEEIDKMLKAVPPMYYPQVDGITPTVVAGSCDDCISRQAAIDAINEYGSVWMEYTDSMTVDEIADRALKASKQSMHKIIHDLPSVTPKPKTGHWIYTDYHTWCCSECGDNPHRGTGFVPNKDGMKMRWKYCNLCGAKMIEPQESEEE